MIFSKKAFDSEKLNNNENFPFLYLIFVNLVPIMGSFFIKNSNLESHVSNYLAIVSIIVGFLIASLAPIFTFALEKNKLVNLNNDERILVEITYVHIINNLITCILVIILLIIYPIVANFVNSYFNIYNWIIYFFVLSIFTSLGNIGIKTHSLLSQFFREIK